MFDDTSNIFSPNTIKQIFILSFSEIINIYVFENIFSFIIRN